MLQVVPPLAPVDLAAVRVEEDAVAVALAVAVAALVAGGVGEGLVALAGPLAVLQLAEEDAVVRVFLEHAAAVEEAVEEGALFGDGNSFHAS